MRLYGNSRKQLRLLKIRAGLVLLLLSSGVLLTGCPALKQRPPEQPHCRNWNVDEWKNLGVIQQLGHDMKEIGLNEGNRDMIELAHNIKMHISAVGQLLQDCFPNLFEEEVVDVSVLEYTP